MKRTLLITGLFCATLAYGQTTLFQDNFESGSSQWTLNGGSGGNTWIVSSEYIGFSGFIDDTPDQPAGTTNGPESMYMHIYNASACGGLGVCNATFDTGSTSNQPTTMASGISTTGYGNVTLSFIYLCAGQTGSAYGTVEYSTDNGTSWNAATTYSNVTTWTNASLTLPAWDNQANLKFRFRWQNASQGNDPAFAVDEVSIVGTSGTFASVTAGTPNPNQYCAATTTAVAVNFTVTGTINAGNIYTAELSNASGSFASPTTIGTLSSTSTGALVISGTIPSSVTAGTGYRIRVNSSNPANTGTDNGVNLVVNTLPTMSVLANPMDGIICPGESVSLLASGAPSVSWSPTIGLSTPNSATTSASPTTTVVYIATGTDANGCSNTASFTVTVNSCAGIDESELTSFKLYPNPASDVVYITTNPSVTVHSVEILDLSGRVVQSHNGAQEKLMLTGLSTGTYVVRVQSSAGMATQYIMKD